jgi:hypothetical protein
MDNRRVTLTHWTTLRFGSLGFVYTGPVEPVAGRTFARPPHPNVLTAAAGREAFVRGFSDDVIIGMLGQTQRMSVLGLLPTTSPTSPFSPAKTDRWVGGVHGAVHRNVPPWQPGLPDDTVTAYVNGLRTTGAAPGSPTTRRAPTVRSHDPTRECNIMVASSSSSSEPEPAPRHRGANAQWRALLDELAEARRQLDEELALLHQELGVDAEPRDRQPAQGVHV